MRTIEDKVESSILLNKKWIEITTKNPNELKNSGLGLRFLEEDFVVKAIKDKEFNKAKQHFYTASLIDIIRISKFNNDLLKYELGAVFFPILSDNEELIQIYSKLRYQPWGKMKGMDENVLKGNSDVWCNTVQLFMANNREGIECNLNIIEAITIKQVKSKPMINDYEFFKALHSGDKEKMEEVLEILTCPKIHKKRTFNDLHAQHVSILGLGYAKLAWRKGIEVEVKSELVPCELLPIKPLDKYEVQYDFLKNFI